MLSAFCPGHVSCVFQPVSSYDTMCQGSRGFGIRLSLGARADVSFRDDGTVNIWLDGLQSIAPVTRMAVECLAPGQGMDIRIENDLPVSQGFGMSAAGALAASLCVASATDQSRFKAFEAAHVAEVRCGGGLGDVAAIVAGGDIPVRAVAGMPPHGKVVSAPFRMEDLTLVVIGPVMKTDSVLNDVRAVDRIRAASAGSMEAFLAEQTVDSLFEQSCRFSAGSGVESPAIRRAIQRLESKGFRAGMCMLGNSIFTDAPESDVWSLLGRGRVRTYPCSSSSREILVRRA